MRGNPPFEYWYVQLVVFIVVLTFYIFCSYFFAAFLMREQFQNRRSVKSLSERRLTSGHFQRDDWQGGSFREMIDKGELLERQLRGALYMFFCCFLLIDRGTFRDNWSVWSSSLVFSGRLFQLFVSLILFCTQQWSEKGAKKSCRPARQMDTS